MCVNAMWMCHHWFMHIETHPCLGRSHTRASTMVIMVIIHNTFHVHMVLQLFLTPPPKMGRSPRDNNFAILAIIVWAWYLHAALTILVMKGATFLPICQKFEIFAANWGWWIGHLSPKYILVGPTISLIFRINVWAMQLIKLPFPCSNSWNKSRCWEHIISHSLVE